MIDAEAECAVGVEAPPQLLDLDPVDVVDRRSGAAAALVAVEEVDIRAVAEPAAEGRRAPRLKKGYRWRRAMPAGTKRTLRAAYEIKIPSKAELVGGNRREP